MRRAALVATILLVLMGAVTASAQDGKFTMAVILGQQNNYDLRLDGDFAIGLQLGWNFNENWALQGEISFCDPSVDTPQDFEGELAPGVVEPADVMVASLNLVHYWPGEASPFAPFVAVGASWGDVQYNGLFYQDEDPVAFGLNLAGGLKYDLAGTSFALAELRWNSLFDPNYDVLQFFVGFGFGI